MTEYDYSPEAYERFLENQNRVARWVDDANRHSAEFQNPISPSSSSNGSNDHTSHWPSQRHLEVRAIPHRRSSSVGSPSDNMHRSIRAAPTPHPHRTIYAIQPTQGTLPVPQTAPGAYRSMTRPPSPRYSLYPPSQKPPLVSRRSQSHEPRYRAVLPGSSDHHSHRSRRRSPSRTRHHSTIMVKIPIPYAQPQRQPISAPPMIISPPLSAVSPPLGQYSMGSTMISQNSSFGAPPGYSQYPFIPPYQHAKHPGNNIYPYGPYAKFPVHPVPPLAAGVPPMTAYLTPPITPQSYTSSYGPRY